MTPTPLDSSSLRSIVECATLLAFGSLLLLASGDAFLSYVNGEVTVGFGLGYFSLVGIGFVGGWSLVLVGAVRTMRLSRVPGGGH